MEAVENMGNGFTVSYPMVSGKNIDLQTEREGFGGSFCSLDFFPRSCIMSLNRHKFLYSACACIDHFIYIW